ncbi:GAF domain-containing protein [bacterium]|nr:GAF domain-containing protein [bacterium]
MSLSALIDELIETGQQTTDFPNWEKWIVKQLQEKVSTYSWVGFYWVVGDELLLGAWDGPEATEHVRIPIGEGICGLAARTKETVLVDDVNEREDYLACFPYTRSEIVVPILRDGEAIGEIDIDGDEVGAFGDEDRKELERLAEVIGELFPH